MRRPGPATAVLAAGLLTAGLLAAPAELPAQDEAPRDTGATTLDGVYTLEQARRGEEVFSDACGQCHVTSRFTGPDFVPSWSQAPLSTLFTVIRTQMPFDNPGSLEPDAYAAVIAYIFRLNGLPAGDRMLAGDVDSLRAITIEFEVVPDGDSDP